MKHVHKYQTVSHPIVSADAGELGISGAEIRRCEGCQKELVFILTKHEKWIPLFEDRVADEQDILLA